MKTKFFKKLSFVLVVAMVLSLFVPAAGVFAAAKPSLNSKNKYLHLSGNPGPNEYNFNVKNKKKGWKYFWESSKENVAEVNEKNGVTTATGVGKTKITLTITDKNGEEIQTLSATVTVRDNIKEVSISNPVKTLAVGEEHDYNRSYVTEANSTKKTSSITRWTVSPDTATIDDKGVFVATAGGEYTVTALSFQSKAKYNDWKADAEKYATNVLDTDETKVVVSANIVGVKQVNKTQFTVEFDSSMKDTDLSKDTAMVYQIINGKQYNTGTEKINSLNLDDTGKIATVEIFGNLLSKTEYQFVYGDLKDGFTAASTDWSDIAGIRFDDFQVKTDSSEFEMLDKLNAVNAQGIVIKSGHEIASYVNFTYDGDFAYGWLNGTKIFMIKNGHTAKITAKYNNFIYDDVTKTYKESVYEDTAVAIGVDVVLNNTTMQYAVARSTTNPWELSWNNDGFTIPAADGEIYEIYTRFKKNTDPAWADYTEDKTGTNFKYVSTDSSKLVIDGVKVFGITPGVVTVLVQDRNNKDTVVGAFDITILSSRVYAEAKADKHNVAIGNYNFGPDSIHNEVQTITITNTDTMGYKVAPKPWDISAATLITGPTGYNGELKVATGLKKDTNDVNDGDYGLVNVVVKAAGATPGRYQYKFDIKVLNTTKTLNVYVDVLDSNPSAVTDVRRWGVEFNKDSVDARWLNGEETIAANVYGYNKNNARIYVLSPNEYTLTVNKSAGGGIKTPEGISLVNSSGIKVAYKQTDSTKHDYFATGKGLSFVDLTNYVAIAKVLTDNGATITKQAKNTNFATGLFKVEDSTGLELIREKELASATLGNVNAAIMDVYKFKINGGELGEGTPGLFSYKITKGGVLSVTDGTSDSISSGENVYVHEIYYLQSRDGGNTYVKYTFNVGQTITITK